MLASIIYNYGKFCDDFKSTLKLGAYETALLNGLKPYVYLTYVLDQIRQMGPFPKPEELDRLLPWSDDLPDEFRTKNQG